MIAGWVKWAAAVCLLVGACRGPVLPECRVPCTASSGCPQGFSCSNGFCAAQGGVGTCPTTDAHAEAAPKSDATDTAAEVDGDGDAGRVDDTAGDLAPEGRDADAESIDQEIDVPEDAAPDASVDAGPRFDAAGTRPPEVRGLRLWLDAADLPKGRLFSWPDKSRYGFGADNHEIGGRLVVTIDGQSGLPVVDMSGMSDMMMVIGDYSDFTAGLAIFMVVYPRLSYVPLFQQEPVTHLIEFGTGRVNARDRTDSIVFQRTGDGEAQLELMAYRFADSGGISAPQSVGNYSWQIFEALQGGGSPGDTTTATLLKNGLPLVTGASLVPDVVQRQGVLLGGSTYRLPGFVESDGHYLGRIAEVLVYGSTLTDADRMGIEDYLSAKWQVALDR